jgi:hypothetical protein
MQLLDELKVVFIATIKGVTIWFQGRSKRERLNHSSPLLPINRVSSDPLLP